MSLLDITFPASYKGINFLVDNTITKGGIKNVKHVYPNSDNQNIEILGGKQNTYPIRAFINNDPELDNYEIKRNALIAVLNDQKSGLLIHPFLGHIEDVIATDWTLSEDFSEFGKAKFNITFEVSLSQSVPLVASNTLSQVRNIQDSISESVTNDISENFLIDFSNNINDSISQVNGIIEDINENSNLFSIADDQLNTFNNEVGRLSANVANLVRDPAALSESLSNVFNTISGMYVTSQAAFGVMANFFGFGKDDIPIDTNTRSNIERKKNRQILNDAVNAYALAYAYTLGSEIEFTTIDQQDEISDVLEDQYELIIEDTVIENLAGVDELIGVSTDSKIEITDQRVAVEKLFDDNKIILGQIIDVFTHETSTRLLAYQYYGESTLGEEIANLNNISDPSFISGNVKIISS